MSFDEFRDLRREARKDADSNCLYMDRFKNKNTGEYCTCHESEETLIEYIPETSFFWK